MLEERAKAIASYCIRPTLILLSAQCSAHLPTVVGRLNGALIPYYPIQAFPHQTLFYHFHHVQLDDIWVGEDSDLGLRSLGGRKLFDHIGEVHAYFAGRVSAESKIGRCHLMVSGST